jgi:hypothetical protein
MSLRGRLSTALIAAAKVASMTLAWPRRPRATAAEAQAFIERELGEANDG